MDMLNTKGLVKKIADKVIEQIIEESDDIIDTVIDKLLEESDEFMDRIIDKCSFIHSCNGIDKLHLL